MNLSLLFVACLLEIAAASSSGSSDLFANSGGSSTQLLSDEVVQDFKSSLGLKQDYQLFLQEIAPHGTFQVPDLPSTCSLDNLTPYSTDSEDMTTVIDGQELPTETNLKMFLGDCYGRSFLAVMDDAGYVLDIEISDFDESVIFITEVFDTGVYAIITDDAYEPRPRAMRFLVGNKENDTNSPGERDVNAPSHHMLKGHETNLRGLQTTSCSSYRQVELAIAFDSSFCNHFGGSRSALDEVRRIVAFASTSWYRKGGLCLDLLIRRIEGECDASTGIYNRSPIESGCVSGFLIFYQALEMTAC